MAVETVTIIICTMDRPGSLKRALDSILIQTVLPDEIIVVDASKDNQTQKVIEAFLNNSKLLLEYFHTEPGLTKQRNFGIEKAKGSIIGFIDDDVSLEPNYLALVKEAFENDAKKEVGGLTGFVYQETAPKPLLRRFFYKVRSIFYNIPRLYKIYGIPVIPEVPFDSVMQVRHVSGCNMFFRRNIFTQFAFDTWFEGYGLGEDRDFGIRISQKYKVLCIGSARLWHFVEKGGKPNLIKLGKMMIENPMRILSVARKDYLKIYGIALLFNQMSGIFFDSVTFLLRGQFQAGFDYMSGAFSGVIPGWNHLRRAKTAGKRF
jgi:glycosyltransferase involved in cell wall biosynthesis